MKNKIWALALILLVSGLALMLCVLAVSGFSFTAISTLSFTESSVDLTDAEITDIEIDTGFFDVVILPTEEGEGASVRHAGCAEYFHMIELTDGKLSIRVVDNRAWYQKIGIFNTTDELSKLELRLPKGIYRNLKITTASGDTTVNDTAFVFDTAAVFTASGDTQLFATVGKECQVNSASGDIEITNMTGGPIIATTASGDIVIADCTPRDLYIESASGDITLARILLTESTTRLESASGEISLTDVLGGIGCSLEIKTASGDVSMLQSDAGHIVIDTTSGEVKMRLLSGKDFQVSSTSGDLDYPASDSTGGICRVETTSDDVEISVAAAAATQ
ncbi:MAG: DUF4097 family beta strand repeat protein [Clostridia bacterium]|nr:DUF4097 family beta strand repeat protein [Clostridia bacterium]